MSTYDPNQQPQYQKPPQQQYQKGPPPPGYPPQYYYPAQPQVAKGNGCARALGIGLLTLGVLGVLGSCGLLVLAEPEAKTVFQEQAVLLYVILGFVGAGLLFVLPGLILIV